MMMTNHPYTHGRFGDDGRCHAPIVRTWTHGTVRCSEPRSAHVMQATAAVGRWRVERGGTTTYRLPGWFAVLTAADGTIARCAHVPTFADAWSVVDLHTTSEASA
ncbi:hypothetical protein [Curtobacterium sp. VKM Ac-1376]|uniref:hypothetical protein n=1 Tax=Curtobacterium sp. VKM Ac-1376 TaxID=123312 RepID=UPI00188D047A|nr:hypothetical protein [Curtobacterium sp. VKM Ac-1376]MBF4613261.1 hypothetical protein [Curtobacterium sp. VKM Ac-1376]